MNSYISVIIKRGDQGYSNDLYEASKLEPDLRQILENNDQILLGYDHSNVDFTEILDGEHPALAQEDPPYIITHTCEIICD